MERPTGFGIGIPSLGIEWSGFTGSQSARETLKQWMKLVQS